MARKRKGAGYTGDALKDGYTCTVSHPRGSEIDNWMKDDRDEYEQAFEALGEFRGRGMRRLSTPEAEDDDGFFY